jgi:hypothetical protein
MFKSKTPTMTSQSFSGRRPIDSTPIRTRKGFQHNLCSFRRRDLSMGILVILNRAYLDASRLVDARNLQFVNGRTAQL